MPEPQSVHQTRVVAIVSSFQPSSALVEHCVRLQGQVARVIVVDDGSGPSANAVLNEIESLGVVVIRNEVNAGIGHAMNTGYATAQSEQPEFIVTFDQDSEVPEGFIDALIREYDRLTALGFDRVGMVAPEFFSQTRQSTGAPEAGVLVADAVIQSGLLMPTSVIEELGPQREDFFIDLIDTDYYFRAKRAGFVAVCVPGLTLPHGFGHRLYVHAFGKRLTKSNGKPRMVAVSTPFRYYYRARNRVLLNRELKREKSIRSVLRRQTRNDLLLDFGVAIYSARGKWALMRVIVSGWRDGLRGRSGKMPSHVADLARRVGWRHPVEQSEA